MKKPRREYASLPWQKRPPQRTILPLAFLFCILWVAHGIWQPGHDVTDGRHDKGRNALWLQHGWLGNDRWFVENHREAKLPLFRNGKKLRELASLLRRNQIADVFPHLCPVQLDGSIMPVDDPQTELMVRELKGIRVIPWIGGPREDVAPDDAKRRKAFVQSVKSLFHRHPDLAGVHLNVEPWLSGSREMLMLLDELRAALPKGKILSVAAYPPPTWWQPLPDVHWDKEYFLQVAVRCDQMVVMMYDTGIRSRKVYEQVMRGWTRDELDWTKNLAQPPQILLGLPAYEDDELYHRPGVENLETSLLGIHAGLSEFSSLPANYQGAAIYSDWTMDTNEWHHWRTHFCQP